MRAEPATTRRTTAPDNSEARLDELVASVLTGDRTALEAVLRIVRPAVVRYCRSRLGGTTAGDVDDVAQDVCLAVLRALPGYRDQGRTFLAFVYGVAAHKIVDARRSAARRPAPLADTGDREDADDGPETLAVRREGEPGLRRCVAALPRAQQEVLHLRVVVGLSAEETATAVGSTAGAVRVAQHRALTALRRSFPSGPADGGPTGDRELDSLFAEAETALVRLAETGTDLV